ncbi:MAG TPA: hypothetical protein VFF16_05045 [Telluria sp.]|nr:hypothetical protein [Telluria sp.]
MRLDAVCGLLLGLMALLVACGRQPPVSAGAGAGAAAPARPAPSATAAQATPGQGMAAFPMLYRQPASEPPALQPDPRPRIAAAIARGQYDAALALADTPSLRRDALAQIRAKNEADAEERLASDRDREPAPGLEK